MNPLSHTTRPLRFLIILVCFLSCTPLVLATDVVTTWDHSGDGNASGTGADATADELLPTQVAPVEEVNVRFQNGQKTKIPAIRFDLSQLRALTDAETLALQVYDLDYTNGNINQKPDGKKFNLWVVTDGALNNWDESTATWDVGFPGLTNDGTPLNGPDFTGDVTLVETFVYTPSGNAGWCEPVRLNREAMDIVNSLQGSEVTFYLSLVNGYGSDFTFGSKENTTTGVGALAPRLSIVDYPVEDFGLNTRGGYGGQVIKVTNLNTDGPGSLREALDTPGPRIIVFEVGGVIDMGGDFNAKEWIVSEPYLTIAGQTAPSPGITLIKGELSIRTHDVIIQHIRIRPGEAGFAKGSGWDPDALNVVQGHNVLIDHVSATWATDEGISVSGPRDIPLYTTSYNVTIRNSIIGEGLSNSTHGSGEHSKGSLMHDHVRAVAIVGNLYVSNEDRNPYYKAETTGFVANNVIYNPGGYAIRYGFTRNQHSYPDFLSRAHLTVVGNHYRSGPDTDTRSSNVRVKLVGTLFGSDDIADIYLQDNIAETQTGDPISLIASNFPQTAEPVVWPEGFKAMPATEVWDHVLAHAGARPNENNPIDIRIKKSVMNGTGAIIDSQDEVGGYPNPTPTSHTLNVPTGEADAVEEWLRAWSAKWMPTSR